MPLKIAVPNKGRLMDDSIDLLRSVGIRVPHHIDRLLVVLTNGGRYEILFTRAGDIPEYVALGAADVGVTGLDLVEETGVSVRRLLDLDYGRCKLVLAVPEAAKIDRADRLPAGARVATSFPNLTRRFFESRNVKVEVIPVSGAAEITPHLGVADAITDLTQSGATLKQNHLVVLDTILESWSVLIASPGAMESRAQDIENLVEAVRGVQAAHRKRYLMANVPESAMSEVVQVVPGIGGPTVMKLATSGMVAVHAVVAEDDLNHVVTRLKKLGATGILVLPIERLIP